MSQVSQAILDELAGWVIIEFEPDGQLRQLRFPTDRELTIAITTCGGNKIHGDVEEIAGQLYTHIRDLLPKLAAKAQPKDRRHEVAKQIILQIMSEGRYASPLLHGRYQILEMKKDHFKILDHDKLTMDPKKDWAATINYATRGNNQPDPIYFGTKKEAESYLTQLIAGKAPTMEPIDSTPRAIAKPVVRPPAKGETSAKMIPRKSTPGVKKESMASMIRRLISETKLSDEKISAQVLKEYPNLRKGTVEWYRKKMAEG